jgi:DNA-binding NarL/FixJ family response regulator
MPGSDFWTVAPSSSPHRLSAHRGEDVVLVAMRAGDASSFLALIQSLLPEGAAILEIGETTSKSNAVADIGQPPQLTVRQSEVLGLLAEGLSNKQIARHLALSHFTVRNHVSQILRAFNLSSRHQAMAWVETSGRIRVMAEAPLQPHGIAPPERPVA